MPVNFQNNFDFLMIFVIIYSIYLFKVAQSQPPEIKRKEFLTYAAVINIIFALLTFFVPRVYLWNPISDQDSSTYLWYSSIRSLLFNIPPLYTYGAAYIIFGKKNQKKIGNYLTRAGLLWLSSNLIFLITDIVLIYVYHNLFISGLTESNLNSLEIISTIFLTLTLLLDIFAATFVALHALKNNDTYFQLAVLILFLTYGILIFVRLNRSLLYISNYLWL
jgi:hypothetical protein